MQDLIVFLQNHSTLSTAFAIVLILIIILEFIKLKGKARQVSPLQLTQLINRENPAIIDTRPTEAYIRGHIIGAVSIPATELKSKKLEKFKTQTIVLVCATGQDAEKAAALLQKEGFNILTLANGMRSWIDADMPLVKGS